MEPISRTATVNILAVRLQGAGSNPVLLTSHPWVLSASTHIIPDLSTESESTMLPRSSASYCLLPLLMAMEKSMHESEKKKKNLKNWYSSCSEEKIGLS